MTEFNRIQSIKRSFFALRNGVIADTLRKAGSPYKIIFGLNLPQLTEIASREQKDAEIAGQLWQNTTTRESMMLAPMLYPAEQFTEEIARRWIESAVSTEAIDILCHRLLRFMPYAFELVRQYIDSDADLERYAAIRLLWRFLGTHRSEALTMANREIKRKCPLTFGLALQLADEVNYMIEIEKEQP